MACDRKERDRRHCAAHADEKRAKARAWYWSHREQKLASMAAYRERRRAYRAERPEVHAAHVDRQRLNRKRRALRKPGGGR